MQETLSGFKTAQRLAYDTVLEVKEVLRPGMTEIDAARLLAETLNSKGIIDWFHTPLAWFGERTRFDKMKGFRDFLPSRKTLRETDVVILDIAPLVDGFIGDVGYTYSVLPNAELDAAKLLLRKIRSCLPDLFVQKQDLGQVWQEVDCILKNEGYDNCYRLYPFSVLGHKITKLTVHGVFGKNRLRIPLSYMSWFGFSAYDFFLRKGISSNLLQKNSSQDRVGLWAIEPHLGSHGFGAKFEEILVVDRDRSYWLTDDVPHFS